MNVFDWIKDKLNMDYEHYEDFNAEDGVSTKQERLAIKLFSLEKENDIKDIIEVLREGKTVIIINRGAIKEDYVLRPLINKLRKTCDAIDGDIAGLSESWFIATPSFVKIDKHFTNK